MWQWRRRGHPFDLNVSLEVSVVDPDPEGQKRPTFFEVLNVYF
jgi:hypothetical protein